MSGSDKTRARRNAKVRMNRLEGKATIKDLAELRDAMGDDMPEAAIDTAGVLTKLVDA